MTLSIKVKHTGAYAYACAFVRDSQEVLRLEPGEEGEITLWSGAPVTMKEVLPKNVAKAAPPLPIETGEWPVDEDELNCTGVQIEGKLNSEPGKGGPG